VEAFGFALFYFILLAFSSSTVDANGQAPSKNFFGRRLKSVGTAQKVRDSHSQVV
jgi:hypothetical protein